MDFIGNKENVKTVVFNCQGLIRYINKYQQSLFFKNISLISKELNKLGISVYWVFVDSELSPKKSKLMADVARNSNVSKITNISTMDNLPDSINDLQQYFILNGWNVLKSHSHLLLAQFQTKEG